MRGELTRKTFYGASPFVGDTITARVSTRARTANAFLRRSSIPDDLILRTSLASLAEYQSQSF